MKYLLFHNSSFILSKISDHCYNFLEVICVFTADVPVQVCEQPTNGVTYFRAVTNASQLDSELIPYLPIFCNVLAQYV